MKIIIEVDEEANKKLLSVTKPWIGSFVDRLLELCATRFVAGSYTVSKSADGENKNEKGKTTKSK